MIHKIKLIIKRYIDKIRFRLYLVALRQFGINVVYNSKINKHVINGKYFNVLYISESPAYADSMGWFSQDSKYDLEVSYRCSTFARSIIEPGPIYPVVDAFCCKEGKVDKDIVRRDSFVMTLSEKNFLPGHVLRQNIYEKYKNDEMFRFYGKGAGNSIGNVCHVYRQVKIVLIIENYKDAKYASEKIYDAIWSESVSIYYGACKKLKAQGFDMNGIVCINDLSDVENTITKIKVSVDEFYTSRIKSLKFNKSLLNKIRSDATKQFIENIAICQFIRSSEQYKTKKSDWDKFSYGKGN